MGRTLYAHEVYRMNAARNVYEAYHSRSKVENWAEWADRNPKSAELLTGIERLLDD